MSDLKTIQSLYRDVTKAAVVGLLVNVLLGGMKLAGGLISGSFALIADAINSIGDVVSTIVVLVGLKIAQRPPDEEHPYGHTRAEGIAASNVAVLIIVSAILVAWESLQRLHGPTSIPPLWAIGIAAVNVVIKELLYQYNAAVGKRTGSAAMQANAWDHRSDALCSLAVLGGLGVIRIGGEEYGWADEIASILVALIIAWSGARLFKASASELMDVQADSDLVDAIRQAARNVPGVEDVETLWVRKSGIEFFADIHIEVDQNLSVEEGHAIGHRVKAKLVDGFVNLRDVLVHIEPFPHSRDDAPENR